MRKGIEVIMTTISFVIIAAACILAAILNLAAENRFRNRILSASLAVSVILGLLLYGYGFVYESGLGPASALRTIVSVCRMISGDNDYEVIQSAPIFAINWVNIVFWLAHFLAFYALAGTTIAVFGDKLLCRIRIALAKRRTLLLIYGASDNAIEYARRQMDVMNRSVVFVGQCDASLESTIYEAGCLWVANGDQPDGMLLRKLGIRPGKRHVEVAALHDDGAKNFVFAQKLQEAFEKDRILPQQTMLLLRDVDEDHAASLSASEKKYGYGSVMAFTGYELASRLMIQEMPPCDTIRFDENARAQEDFNVLMVGFGRMGRAALNALLMNGQFYGSKFRADIFDPNAQNGMLNDHEILRQYDIRFHKASGTSEEFYALLKERKDVIRYIVLCTGSKKENREIAQDLSLWFQEHGAAPAIVQCTENGLAFLRPGEKEQTYRSIYGSNALDLEHIDRMAMVINHAYSRNSGNSPLENWKHCDYFSRMSCRASADFYQAILRAAGKTVQQVESGDWALQGEMLENLSITEHMRWCAFHHVMGFRTMSETEFDRRADRYRTDVKKDGSSSLRISKDVETRKHACLIPWEELDRLSERENAVTGKQVDYKQMDRNNILILPELLAVLREMPERHEA